MSKKRLNTFVMVSICCLSMSVNADDDQTSGRWIAGDLHIHTALSADARTPLKRVLKKGIVDFGLDYLAISNHLRNNSRDNKGDRQVSQLFSSSLAEYELPVLQELRNTYPNTFLASTFEWDVPTHDHMNVGIFPEPQHVNKIDVTRYFEYRFGAKNTLNDFSKLQQDIFTKQQVPRQNKTHQDALAAMHWLQSNYPNNSYIMLNHPTRYSTSYSIEDIRQFHDAAPNVFFLLEGMVGNQFNGYRGDYNDKSRAGLLGGVDPFTAEVGGDWDALLGEGRHIWMMANSDHHFKAFVPHASGYYPGEYSKSYTYLNSPHLNLKSWLQALRSGNSFSVYGDIINSLNFTLTTESKSATMGETLHVRAGKEVTITIEVAQPAHNNREENVGNENYNGRIAKLDHIDLIAGDVKGKAKFGTVEYTNASNPTTHIIHSFTAKDWHVTENGHYKMSYTFIAQNEQYFRLRGTTLDYEKKGLTKQGEPLRSKVIKEHKGDSVGYYEKINQRNYTDTWFYSNPIFLQLDKSSPVTVESLNLRYDNPDDGINAWPNRRSLVQQHIEQQQPDILGMQEVLAKQFNWLKMHLVSYGAIGVGRDDGVDKGEFVPLFYNQTQLEKLDSGYFWLSETPNKAGSIGWGADLPRITTWGKFKKQDRVFFVFNTHFSHVSDLARQKSAEFLIKHIPTITKGAPFILTGDFNATDSQRAYKTLNNHLFDSAHTLGSIIKGTFNDFSEQEKRPRIDYIFYSPQWHSDQYQTYEVQKEGVYISDHFPISTRLQ